MKININNRHLVKIYEITLPVLAIISLFTLMSLGSNFFRDYLQNRVSFLLNHLVWLIFTADFFVRMRFSNHKKQFITRHLAELTAIVPVLPFIMLSRLMADLEMASAAKLLIESIFIIKFFSYLIRAFVTQRRFIKTNPLHYAALVTLTALVVAAMLFSKFEGKNYSDSIWWAFTTASTTGYGDIVPVTPEGRFVGILLMIVGLACISTLTGVIARRLMHPSDLSKSESSMIKSIIKDLSRFSELSSSEVEEICTVLLALNAKQVDTTKQRIKGPVARPGTKTDGSGAEEAGLVKWAHETFVSYPEEDLIIENKILDNER